jgi:hypothetical protein
MRNHELHNVHSSQNIIRMMVSCERHVARMGQKEIRTEFQQESLRSRRRWEDNISEDGRV